MKKLNCWEHKKCGRHFGGEKVSDLGLCPVVIEISLEGVHDGEFGGRACWVLEGTICKGEIQGTFATKFRNCIECDFLSQVKTEEGADFCF